MSINQPPLVEDRIDNNGLIDATNAKVPKHLESKTDSLNVWDAQNATQKEGVWSPDKVNNRNSVWAPDNFKKSSGAKEVADSLPQSSKELPKPLQVAVNGKDTVNPYDAKESKEQKEAPESGLGIENVDR